MSAAPVPDGTLVGYRLVRKLAAAGRSDVYLGVGSTGAVALKVFRPSTTRESVEAELDALGRLESPHLVRLRDLSRSSAQHPVLVLERIARVSIASLLAGRAGLDGGEAVTLLAPMAALVAELHDAGVGHGALTAASIHLDAAGRPVLLGLGHCALFASGGTMAALDTEPAAIEDRDSLAALALSLLAQVHDPGRRASDLVQWIETAPRAYEFPRELEQRLFAFAEPLPVSFSTDRPAAAAVPSRVVPAQQQTALERPSLLGQSTDPLSLEGHRLPGWVDELLHDSPVDLLKKRLLILARGVRPRFWVAAGAVVVALVLAIALVPSGGAVSTHTATTQRVRATDASSPTLSPLPDDPLPDDPLRAAGILLSARVTCLRDLSILCLDTVDEASSSAFASDAATIETVQQGGELPKGSVTAAPKLTLTERLGDTALIGLGLASASILVVRTTAGWRIRDYLSGVQATPGT